MSAHLSRKESTAFLNSERVAHENVKHISFSPSSTLHAISLATESICAFNAISPDQVTLALCSATTPPQGSSNSLFPSTGLTTTTLQHRLMATGADFLLSGSAGVQLQEGQRAHEGRRAILLTRKTDVGEFISLASTMGIEIIEVIHQPGSPDPRHVLGSGRLEAIRDELKAKVEGHPWSGVDLVMVHHNASPRQLVNLNEILEFEVWDRVRLLLHLFTNHANSVEARTQVRLARLRADSSVLREIVHRETTGERMGWGAGGKHAWQGVLETVQREVVAVQKKQRKHARSQAERRRQRKKSGVSTIGLAGYTNAGKSTLFKALSGKDVLIEDRLFSTLETTVGRMLSSPRVLMADTIGFIDRIPAELLDAFRATLAESLECDLLLLVLDAGDSLSEIDRKLKTSRRDLLERMDGDDRPITGVVLSKIDLLKEDISEIYHLVEENGLEVIAEVSAIAEQGLDDLCQSILDELIGPPLRFHLMYQTEKDSTPIERLLHDLHECGQMDSQIDNGEQGFEIEMRIPKVDLDRLISRHPNRIKMQ